MSITKETTRFGGSELFTKYMVTNTVPQTNWSPTQAILLIQNVKNKNKSKIQGVECYKSLALLARTNS